MIVLSPGFANRIHNAPEGTPPLRGNIRPHCNPGVLLVVVRVHVLEGIDLAGSNHLLGDIDLIENVLLVVNILLPPVESVLPVAVVPLVLSTPHVL